MHWPPLVDLAHPSGIRAVSAYPLMGESAGVCVTLYRAAEGDPSDAQLDGRLAIARVLTDTLPEVRTAELSASRSEEPIAYCAEFHRASGMVAVQLGVTSGGALLLICAHASARGTSVLDVATEIVMGRLRLHADNPDAQP